VAGGVVVYNWLYHRSGQIVLLVMIIHAMNNASSGELFSPMFTADASALQAWLRALLWGVAAATVLLADWRSWAQTNQGTTAEPKPALNPAAVA
jgi:hypothetical protein